MAESVTVAGATPAQTRIERLRTQARTWLPRAGAELREDWHTAHYFPFAAALLIVATVTMVFFYLNQGGAYVGPDTHSYLRVADAIRTRGMLVDPQRTPVYPLFLAVVFFIFGDGNLNAAAAAQGVLFVLATLELYALVFLLFRRAWIAFIVGLLMCTNTYLLGFVTTIQTEGFAVWLVVSLALAVVGFLQSLRARDLWVVAVLTGALFLTRPEWIYLPIPLFGYLLSIAARRGRRRELWRHAAGAVLALYLVLGLYVAVNAVKNHYAGVSYIQNINLFGKVEEYHMQNEAPPQYADITRTVNGYLARGNADPYAIIAAMPAYKQNDYARMGAYATAIVRGHPLEYLADSVPVAFEALTYYGTPAIVRSDGFFGQPFSQLKYAYYDLFQTFRFFPLFALVWVALLLWKRTTRRGITERMGAVVLLALYEFVMIGVGGYDSFARFDAVYTPLILVTMWGTLLAGILLLITWLRGRNRVTASAQEREGAPVAALDMSEEAPIPSSSR